MTLTPEERLLLAELPFLKAVYPNAERTLRALALERSVREFAASRARAIPGMTLAQGRTRRR